jgi:hypothetical protein
VSWLGIPVVDVDITTVKKDSIHQATYHAQTRPLFDPIYSLDNRYSVLLNPHSGQPNYYEKTILERKRTDHLWARYDHSSLRITYSNGLERTWYKEGHNLFSALQWVQRHSWVLNEKQLLVIETEGVFWEVSILCTEIIPAQHPGGPQATVLVRFERKLAGEPVLSTTDMLTYLLPGEGHRMRIGLDSKRAIVSWLEFGSPPFHVSAELNSGSDQP